MFGSMHAEWGCRGRGRGGWGFDPDFSAWFGGGPGAQHGRGPRGRGGRMFEQGDLKYVILRLLDEKPRHGYEIIKELEDRFGGAYSPSPGTVYPTLTMLEDLGYASARTEEGGRRIYEITDAGRQYLQEHRSTVEEIFERIAHFGARFFSEPMMELNHAFKDLGRATYGAATRTPRDAERVKRIAEILRRAAAEITAL
ncbi:MAG TPA: PadR family transcriptional regulator [Gemmatimonadaceae bacterium]|nr:PadR family transcriptional regulator [Gemmatimonadaceae bacterium]